MNSKFTKFYTRKKQTQGYDSRHVYTTADAHTLLNTESRQRFIQHIRKLSKAPDDIFASLYLPLIEKYAQIVQSLPNLHMTPDKPAEKFDSLIDTALTKATYTLAVRHHFKLPPRANQTTMDEQYPLWTYTLFSSALLWRIGQLCTHYQIVLCDEDGVVSEHWDPLCQGPLYQLATHYKIRHIEIDDLLTTHAFYTHCLARQLMPVLGLQWIAGDKLALHWWLNALISDLEETEGEVIAILSLAHRLLIDPSKHAELLNELKLSGQARLALEQEIAETLAVIKHFNKEAELPPIRVTEPVNTLIGEQFFEWLKEAIANKSITINQHNSPVQITSQGVMLLYPEIFQLFIQAYPVYRDWIAVYTQFSALGLTRNNPQNKAALSQFHWLDDKSAAAKQSPYSRQFQQTPNKTLQGVLINRSFFPPSMNLPDINNQLQAANKGSAKGQYPSLKKAPRATKT